MSELSVPRFVSTDVLMSYSANDFLSNTNQFEFNLLEKKKFTPRSLCMNLPGNCIFIPDVLFFYATQVYVIFKIFIETTAEV